MSRKPKPKRDRTNNSLAQYGLFDMNEEGGDDSGGDDSDLEAELLALSSGGGTKPKRPKPKVAPAVDLDAMVAASLKDIPSDEELSGDDDPDLLNELSEIQGDEPEPAVSPVESKPASINVVAVLEERLKMYETAETNAKEAGETSRARRFGRGIKTLKDMIKQAKAGRVIKEEDIPPAVAVSAQKHEHNNTAPTESSEVPESQKSPDLSESSEIAAGLSPKSSPEVEVSPALTPENEELLQLLNTRKIEYKTAALEAKRSGDSPTAMNYIKIAKQFEAVIAAVKSGQQVDLSNMPGPPSQENANVEESEVQTGSTPAVDQPEEPIPEPTLITASSVAEALQQRLEVYQKQVEKANAEGNSSKARRMGRIVKQYEDAIKHNKAGKPIAVEDLPTPPGYAPIPVEGAAQVPKLTPPVAIAVAPTPSQPETSRPHTVRTRVDKQVALLLARQKEFKEAALNAKKKGELTQAKEFLRTAKKFEPLLDAARGGLPVDISSLPIPPSAKSQLEEEYEIVLGEEVTEMDPEHMDIIARLEQQLTKQLKLCLTTRDHNKAIGDVAGMNRFEHLALSVTRDLDIIRLTKKSVNSAVPKYHYETKDFSIVKSCTDLNDNDLELKIVRGINFTCSNPKDVDTYVKFEFPYPPEEPVKNKTAVIKDTNNPDYDETFVLPIQRTARQCQRVFKRHGIKFEVYSRGCFASDYFCCCSGFFRGDTLIGTVTVKLQPLETQCELHESFDLVEGRKKVGGKLEVHLRVRDPLVTRQVEQLSEKWLVLNH